MTATELIEQVKTLSATEKRVFTELFRELEGNQEEAPASPLPPKVEWPDFMARLKKIWPNGTPGKPASELVDEGRGPRP